MLSGGEADNAKNISDLIFKRNKRFICCLNFLFKLVLLFCFFMPKKYFGQDTISLKVVEVSTSKLTISQIGKKVETIDSTVQQQYKFNSVADVLSANSSIFIKSYGPAGLSTTAFRGGNASQTAVLWNGFNLQNAMLGQADLSLMPSILFENIEVEYGGSSALWGSGSVGGSIHLNNKTLFNQGLHTAANFGTGSYGLKNVSTNILVSKQRFISSTKAYISGSENNFMYKDTVDKENPNKHQQNGNYVFKGFMQELKFLINTKQILSLNAWINANQRHLPSYNSITDKKMFQTDDALRLSANWNFVSNGFKSTVKAGVFSDKINYSDSIASIFSKSKVQTLIVENDNYVTWHKKQQLNFGFNATSSKASTNNYESTKTLSKVAFLLGNKFTFLNNKLIAYVSARAEYFSVGTLPLTGNISFNYLILKNVSWMGNVAKVYRQPTLNELYWQPGGNLSLKPEQGYTYETSVNYKKQIKRISFFISGALFSRKIDNWILWIPGNNGNPSPINIQQVWSRGGETNWKINYQKKKLRFGVGIMTSYILSTIQSSNQENNATVGKQLIYTPRYSVNGNILLGYAKSTIIFFHQYVGYRFTTSDNSEWLNPYHISSLRFNYTVDAKKINFVLFSACNNLFNYNYSILAGRPMPLRNFELGLTIQYKHKKQEPIK